ncbi:MAG TPA: PIN domain-containing protein [Candidatus Saccharimonadia bacterium]|nr:PIN domain-containing protein [Candidatus Saccharimonadia bacterium]
MTVSLAVVSVLLIVLALLRLRHVSLQGLVFGLSGAIIGLLLGALASVPLSKLPDPVGNVLPLAVSLALTLIVMGAVLSRRRALLAAMPFLDVKSRTVVQPAVAEPEPVAPAEPTLPQILVDTSVIIDGRIADIAAAGFVPGRLTVPRFVLAELQNIADSDDAMRRGRGRRGLDVLNTLRELPDVETSIIEDDVPGVREVDAKLVALAQRFSCNVLTTDYNLNRVAQIQGVRVLNVNELSNAIRPVVLPGEELLVRVVQPGKERNQGVGYLADGTMIVVENGDKLIGQEVSTEVTRVFQTVAGKMIFAVPRHGLGGAPAAAATPIAADPTTTPAPAAAPVAPAAAPTAPPADKDAAQRKNRFGRHRGRGNGNKPGPAAGGQDGQSLEDRVIAATTPPNE